jgi:hypothetical protein
MDELLLITLGKDFDVLKPNWETTIGSDLSYSSGVSSRRIFYDIWFCSVETFLRCRLHQLVIIPSASSQVAESLVKP